MKYDLICQCSLKNSQILKRFFTTTKLNCDFVLVIVNVFLYSFNPLLHRYSFLHLLQQATFKNIVTKEEIAPAIYLNVVCCKIAVWGKGLIITCNQHVKLIWNFQTTQEKIDPEIIDGLKTLDFYGQRPWRQGLQSKFS